MTLSRNMMLVSVGVVALLIVLALMLRKRESYVFGDWRQPLEQQYFLGSNRDRRQMLLRRSWQGTNSAVTSAGSGFSGKTNLPTGSWQGTNSAVLSGGKTNLPTGSWQGTNSAVLSGKVIIKPIL